MLGYVTTLKEQQLHRKLLHYATVKPDGDGEWIFEVTEAFKPPLVIRLKADDTVLVTGIADAIVKEATASDAELFLKNLSPQDLAGFSILEKLLKTSPERAKFVEEFIMGKSTGGTGPGFKAAVTALKIKKRFKAGIFDWGLDTLVGVFIEETVKSYLKDGGDKGEVKLLRKELLRGIPSFKKAASETFGVELPDDSTPCVELLQKSVKESLTARALSAFGGFLGKMFDISAEDAMNTGLREPKPETREKPRGSFDVESFQEGVSGWFFTKPYFNALPVEVQVVFKCDLPETIIADMVFTFGLSKTQEICAFDIIKKVKSSTALTAALKAVKVWSNFTDAANALEALGHVFNAAEAEVTDVVPKAPTPTAPVSVQRTPAAIV